MKVYILASDIVSTNVLQNTDKFMEKAISLHSVYSLEQYEYAFNQGVFDNKKYYIHIE